MDDIVERLRVEHDRHRKGYPGGASMLAMLSDAADEIERLRAALQIIADAPTCVPCDSECRCVVCIAKSALAKKEPRP